MQETTKIVLADDNTQFCSLVAERLRVEPDLELVAVVHNGSAAVDAVNRLNPDVLVLDLIMPQLDGLGVIEKIKGKSTAVIVLTAFGKEGLVAQVGDLGADYYMMKPVDVEVLVRRIKQMAAGDCPRKQRSEHQRMQVEEAAVRLLSELGVPSHYKGFRYLTTAIALVVNDRDLLQGVTTQLYPIIAERYGTTGDKVERVIRHAIETTWTRGDLEALHQVFGYSVDAKKGKPTNSSFIAKMADTIRLSLKAG